MILIVLVVLAGYSVACWIWPYRNCRKCDGTARIMSPSGKSFRRCRRCKATGRRLRPGRWIYNVVRSKEKGARQ